jgi:hypothetical protein
MLALKLLLQVLEVDGRGDAEGAAGPATGALAVHLGVLAEVQVPHGVAVGGAAIGRALRLAVVVDRPPVQPLRRTASFHLNNEKPDVQLECAQ